MPKKCYNEVKWGKVGNFGETRWGRGRIGEADQDKGGHLEVLHRGKLEEFSN